MLISENTNASIESIKLVPSGEEYFFQLEQIIRNAQFEIQLQVYLFEYDTTGKKIIAALKEAANRNVKIYLLLDGFGSFYFPKAIINELKQNNINFRYFSPLFSANSFYLGRRLHHKIIVADAKVILIGGINIADKYHGTATEAAWLDYAVEIKGEVAKPVAELCKAIYYKDKKIQRKKIISVSQPEKEIKVRMIQNDWLNRKNEISMAYIKSIRNAKEKVTIVGSYFLPGRKLTNALKKASKNKVKVQLILSGISDLPMTRRASCYFYYQLLSYDIELYEWKESILHGKAAVIDYSWTTIGSFNLNNLSSYASIEMNIEINSVAFSKMYQEQLDQIILKCNKITLESLAIDRNFSFKIVNNLCYYTTRAIEIIMTYLPYKRFNNS